MENILFILLIVVSTTTDGFVFPEYKHIIWNGGTVTADTEIIDEWSTTIPIGDSITPGKSYYKAILFRTKDAIDRYLTNNQVNDSAILIDIKAGKTFKISQKKITKPVTETKEVFDHYEYEVKE